MLCVVLGAACHVKCVCMNAMMITARGGTKPWAGAESSNIPTLQHVYTCVIGLCTSHAYKPYSPGGGGGVGRSSGHEACKSGTPQVAHITVCPGRLALTRSLSMPA